MYQRLWKISFWLCSASKCSFNVFRTWFIYYCVTTIWQFYVFWRCLIDFLYAVFADLIVFFYWVCIKMKHLVLILIVKFFILTFYLVLVILVCSLGFQTLGLALAAFFLDIVVRIHRLKFVFDIYLIVVGWVTIVLCLQTQHQNMESSLVWQFRI